MARKKYQMTGFARLFLVLLISAPLAYMGASYYNGEDGLENLKNLFGINSNENTEVTTDGNSNRNFEEEYKILLEQNHTLSQENAQLKKELEAVKVTLEDNK